ncbi:nonstructural protein [Dipodfec virus UOA04_Rod_843]|nr:nonstructural protein [Dipodfec virus UOA04_Rod_843]
MIYGVYSIFDAKTGFMTPTIEINDQAASRNFCHAVANSDGILYSFAQDFQLYRIGEFDSDTALITPVSPTKMVITGADAFRKMMKEDSSNA